MKFSIIIPCYNDGHLAKLAIDSCLANAFPHCEIIVVDDGSTDDSWQQLTATYSTEPRVRLIRKANGGLSSARNAGMLEAVGDYLLFLDSDDLLAPNYLNAVVTTIRREPSAPDLVVMPFSFFADTKDSERELQQRRDFFPPNLPAWPAAWRAMIRLNNFFPVSAAVIRRAVLTPDLQFDETLRSHEDWDFWRRFMDRLQHVAYAPCLPANVTRIRVRAGMSSNRAVMQATYDEVHRRILQQGGWGWLRQPGVYYVALKLVGLLSRVQRMLPQVRQTHVLTDRAC